MAKLLPRLPLSTVPRTPKTAIRRPLLRPVGTGALRDARRHARRCSPRRRAGPPQRNIRIWPPNFFFVAVDLFFVLSGSVPALNQDHRAAAGLFGPRVHALAGDSSLPLAMIGTAVACAASSWETRRRRLGSMRSARSCTRFPARRRARRSRCIRGTRCFPDRRSSNSGWRNLIFALSWRRLNRRLLAALIVLTAIASN